MLVSLVPIVPTHISSHALEELAVALCATEAACAAAAAAGEAPEGAALRR